MLPKPICRDLLSTIAQQLKWGSAWAYDGQSTLYGVSPLLRSDSASFDIERPDARKPGQTETFNVAIRLLGPFELARALSQFAATPGAALPFDALGALDIVLRQSRVGDAKWLQVGANFLNGKSLRCSL